MVSIANSLAWKLCERFGGQVVQLIVSIVIARILDPTEYGAVAILAVFVTLATVFVESGLSSALIQEKDSDEISQSSVFFYSMFMAVLFYAVLFACSGSIARFYSMPQLEELLKILALVLFPGAFNSLQIAILSKRLEFRTQTKCSLIAILFSGVIGVGAALFGLGAWSLVAYQLSNKILVSILLCMHLKWRPSLCFSWTKTRGLLCFGIKLLSANLIDKLYHNLESLIIGKKFSAATLAFCDKGKMFPLLLIDNVDGAIQSVMFPNYALRRDDADGLKSLLLKTVSASTYFVFPLMVGLACAADSLIWLILGEKWMDAVPFMVIYCAICALFPFQTAGLQALNAVGRSGDYLKVVAIKRSAGLLLLACAAILFDSPFAILWAAFFGELTGAVVSAIPLSKTFGISLFEQVRACFPNLALALFMGIAVQSISFFTLPYLLTLLLKIVVGVSVYLLGSIVFKNENLSLVKDFVSRCFGGGLND